MSDLPLQEDSVPQVITSVFFHLSKKDWYTHHPPLFEVIKDRVLAGPRNLALNKTGFMMSQSSRLRFSFLFWIDIESTLQCTVHGYVQYTDQFVIRVYPHYMNVMFNVDQWQTQGILHCNK